ncbi:MAG: acetyl-CoA acetyltransferase [Acidimicrobiales bacterium]
MALDPRTPVVVGVGQVTSHPDPGVEPGSRPEPLALMVRALRAAAEDCDGAPPGGASPAGDRLLSAAGSLSVVDAFSWPVPNPALLVAEALGIRPAELLRSGVGGNSPQSLLHRSAAAIAAGQTDVALVTGADCVGTRTAARRRPGHQPVRWTAQDAAGTPPPVVFGSDRAPATELETARGIRMPLQAYPLLESSLRAARGWPLDEHRRRIGELWSRFSEVAAGNPYAWLRQPRSAAEIVEPSPMNRMVAFPYTKLCTANIAVDQGAAYVCCSVAAARAAGVPPERWVFPLAGADAHDHWYLSERPELHRSPAIRLAGAWALAAAEVGVDDLGPVDLYSCFPVVVRMAARELGLAEDDPGRPLTVTGGLTFAGGPGNNYTSHGIATLVARLRQDPGAAGLATGLGWYATKHAVGVYASRPPVHQGRDGFLWGDVQASVDALPRCPVDPGASGPVTVETYTVLYGRDGRPTLGILACRTGTGARTWANMADQGVLAELCAVEGIGRAGDLAPGGSLTLS